MTLTRKVLFLIVGALVCVTTVIIAISSLVVLRASHEIEMAQARGDTQRAVGALRKELDTFRDRISDWAVGCDSFSFRRGGERLFVDRNLRGGLRAKEGAPGNGVWVSSDARGRGFAGTRSLDGDQLDSLKVNAVVLADAAGKVVHQAWGSPAWGWQPIPESALEPLRNEKSLTEFGPGDEGRTGFLLLAGEPFLAVSRPVPKGGAAGDPRGSLLMLARLDEARLRAIGEDARLKMGLFPIDGTSVPGEVKSLKGDTGDGAAVLTRVSDRNTVSGYSPILDVSGRPVLALRADIPRVVHRGGLAALRDFTWYLIIICAAAVAVSAVMVRRFMSRLKRVSAAVSDISSSADAARRLPVEGTDELGGMTRGINDMLDSLQKAQDRFRESEERYRTLVESSPDPIIVHRGGAFLYANHAAQRLYGADSFQDLLGRSSFDFVHPEDRGEVVSNYHQSMKAGRIIPSPMRERRIISLDGKIIPVEAATIIVIYQGEPAVQVVMRDITLRKKAEKELRLAKEELEIRVAERNRELQKTSESQAQEVEVRLRAEEALRESEERYRSMVENAPFGVVIHQDGMIRFYNSTARKIVKYDPEDAPPHMKVTDVIHPDDHALVRDMMAKRLRGEAPTNYEVRVVCKDGEVKILDIGNQLFPFKGRTAFLLTAVDVTKKKAAEEALRESEERFRTLANELPNMIFIWSAGRVKYANRRCEEVMGYSRGEFYSPAFNFLSIIAPECRRKVEEAFEQHRDGREVNPYEYTLITRAGVRIEGIITTRLLKYEGQNAILGIVTDITDRKRAEEVLRESEEKFRTLAERLPGMVFINRKGRVEYANHGCETVMGYTREELYADSFDFMTLIAPESRTLVDQQFRRHARGEEVEPYECAVVTREGKRIETIIATKIIHFRGENAVLGIVTDITERKVMEEEIRKANEVLAAQNEELKKLDRIRDGLLRDVTHELKTPVAKHQMQLELLKKIAAECRLEERVKHVFQVMESSIKRQESVIRNILDLSRLEAGGRRYRKEPVALKRLVREVLDDYRYALEARRAEVKLSGPEVTIESDRDMLWHVFSNVVNNAIKFAGRERPAIDIDIGRRGNRAVVRICDNGVGLDGPDRDRVFERFYKCTSSTEGSGVGLTISRKILQDLGGLISIDSPGLERGATVTIEIPVGREA